MKKKIIDHILWILIFAVLIAFVALSVITSSWTADGVMSWILTLGLLIFTVGPWLTLPIEALITASDCLDGRKRSTPELAFNAFSGVTAVLTYITAIFPDYRIAAAFILFMLWSLVRIIDGIIFHKKRTRTRLYKSPAFYIATVLLAAIAVATVIICIESEGKPDEELPDFSSDCVLEAWTGEFDEEKLSDAIETYRTSYAMYVLREEDATEPFFLALDYNASAAKVVRVASVDDTDAGSELSSYIDMRPSAEVYSNVVGIDLSWWFGEAEHSWTAKNPEWSYLVSVTDEKGKEHYYYFRVHYEKPTE